MDKFENVFSIIRDGVTRVYVYFFSFFVQSGFDVCALTTCICFRPLDLCRLVASATIHLYSPPS